MAQEVTPNSGTTISYSTKGNQATFMPFSHTIVTSFHFPLHYIENRMHSSGLLRSE